MNPPELGEALADSFRHPMAKLAWHGAGHTMPPDGAPTAEVAAFIEQHG